MSRGQEELGEEAVRVLLLLHKDDVLMNEQIPVVGAGIHNCFMGKMRCVFLKCEWDQ